MKNTPDKLAMLSKKKKRGGHGRNRQTCTKGNKTEAYFWRHFDKKMNRKNMHAVVKDQLETM